MAPDQRYCLECGERRTPMSSVLLGGPPRRPGAAAPAPAPAGAPPVATAPVDGWQRGATLAVIAGVGVLLLAMGVGVLIGRSGGSKQAAAPQQVISVASAPPAGTNAPASSEGSFTGDWPAGTNGYTVQLQTLPQSATGVSAVEAAKAAATAKGAKSVGALKSGEFSGLPAGRYVIYTGVYHKKAEAERALAGLKRSFPGASVIAVSTGSAGSGGSGAGAAGGAGGGGSLGKPAPASGLPSPAKKGKAYEQESKALPNVMSTG
jgi:hypothetical protein